MSDEPKYRIITEEKITKLAEYLRDHAWLNLSDPSELDCVIEVIRDHCESHELGSCDYNPTPHVKDSMMKVSGQCINWKPLTNDHKEDN